MCSIIWKEVINSYEIVGEGLARLIGNGSEVLIGSDPLPVVETTTFYHNIWFIIFTHMEYFTLINCRFRSKYYME
jgi:hypothetical protein